MIMETHSVGRNAYPSGKKVDTTCHRNNLSSDSEIVPYSVFRLKGRLQRTKRLMIPLTHSFIHSTNVYQVQSLVIKTQPLLEKLSLHQERPKQRQCITMGTLARRWDLIPKW